MSDPPRRALVLTVGTGDRQNPQQTLIGPFRESITDGAWSRIVLLPSHASREQGDLIRSEFPDLDLRVNPLNEPGDEDDADRCYAQFERAIGDLLRDGFTPQNITADFTRGTKAMSAALVLAAVRHGVPQLRYITGQRDDRGIVVPGGEKVRWGTTMAVNASAQIDLAARFVRAGNHGAALELLPDSHDPFTRALWPAAALEMAAFARPVALFYAAWDRLSYPHAAAVALPDPPAAAGPWARLAPDEDSRRWVAALAGSLDFERDLDDTQLRHGAAQLRAMAADLLANGERRIRQEQYEDSVLRAYRILELVGQFRLLDHRLNAAWLDPQDERIVKLESELKRERRGGLGRRGDKLQATREQGARLLRRVGDQFGERLLRAGDKGLVRADTRNKSILVHGFSAAPVDREQLAKTYRDLELLLLDDDPEGAPGRIHYARWLNRLGES